MKKNFLFFFLDDFHHGAVNHVLHFIGFTVLGYGLGKPNVWIILISPFIMEAGHIYNYLKGKDRDHAIKILPLQLIAWVIFVAIGFAITRIFLTY